MTIAIHDAAEGALQGALVSGQWSGGYAGAGTCTTDGSGNCRVSTGNLNNKKNNATFTVGTVSHPTFTYRASGNHDIDGDSSGSTITVTKP